MKNFKIGDVVCTWPTNSFDNPRKFFGKIVEIVYYKFCNEETDIISHYVIQDYPWGYGFSTILNIEIQYLVKVDGKGSPKQIPFKDRKGEWDTRLSS